MSQEVDKDSLNEFLKGTKESIPLPAEDMKDIQKELAGEHKEDPEAAIDEIDASVSMDPTFLPNQNTQNEKMNWSMTVPRVGNVEVNSIERKLYIKGLLNDAPISFEIEVEGANTILEFQTKTAEDLDVIFLALAADISEGFSKDPASHLSRLQQYSLCYMLKKVGGVAFERFAPDKEADYKEKAEALRKHRHKIFSRMQTPRINLLVYAGAIFEAKIATCDRNIHNRNFFDPAE